VTDVNAAFVRDLVGRGLERREALWLVEEFSPGADVDAARAVELAGSRRLAGEPLQYVLGHWPFRTLDLDVDSRVLIPRPETEELVSLALQALVLSQATSPLVLDMGCGSGAIGLSILSELAERGVAATVVAVDVSNDALDVARRNAVKHGLRAVSFVNSSWFRDLDPSLQGHVDLVVSNPPYVGESEFENLDAVLRHEPYGALVSPSSSGIEGFKDLEIVVRESITWLRPGGSLVCEHGSTQADALVQLATSSGFVDVVDVTDLAGLARVLVARKPRT
jgi:release factor glutamine methyltransferase